ncbi:LapA family protein [Variovorax soli]|uniref:LapA family protein n=1 Tax=Variovorax soli TaxID=376815 RepID=UPI000837B419|nr:LapA family protein [Variovorax soli]
MKYLLWLLKAAIFFTLFAFALNNQHDATVNFFFGTYWRAPLVLVVLVAFAGGMVVGALGMLPGWWRHRSNAARPAAPPAIVQSAAPAGNASVASDNLINNNNSSGTDLTVARHHGL